MSSIDSILELNSKFKPFLEKEFKEVYIEDFNHAKEDGVHINDNNIFLENSIIEKKEESIINRIDSIASIKEINEKILLNYDNFIKNYREYISRVEDKIDDRTKESFLIILKSLQNRQKKLNTTLKRFKIKDNWNIYKTKEEFYFKFQSSFSDIIKTTLVPIENGLKENSSYKEILNMFNDFLSTLNIYTFHSIKEEEIPKDDEEYLFEPQACSDCETEDIEKRNKIKEILSYPYVIDINSETKIILEGRVIYWRYVGGRR